MDVNISDDLVHIVILDISGLYAQIYDQGWYSDEEVDKLKSKYSAESTYMVIEIK